MSPCLVALRGFARLRELLAERDAEIAVLRGYLDELTAPGDRLRPLARVSEIRGESRLFRLVSMVAGVVLAYYPCQRLGA